MQQWNDLAVFIPTNLEQWREEQEDDAQADTEETPE